MISNTPELSVSELSLSLKKTVEDAYGRVRVRGELSRVTFAKSGHVYTNLKDENAVLDAVCWKGSVNKLSIRPEEGMEVICTGRLTTFAGKSSYQMIIEDMELAGEGALLKLLEQRKQRLIDEGLFDEDHKKQLPFLPKTIGVVTSPTGAVIRDIIHRIRDRFPCHIIVWPVQVQGQGADIGIARAIAGFNKVKTDNRPDLIIVARGGGSLEDLMPFNEESVVRAVYVSDIPVISAVGHETDTTLCDFVADRRAPTPTGAAEMAVPVRDNLTAQVMDDGVRLKQCLTRTLNDLVRTIEQTSRILSNPMRMVEPILQKFDMMYDKLNRVFEGRLNMADKNIHGLSGRLQTPKAVMDTAQLKIDGLNARLQITPTIERQEANLNNAARMLETLSYKSALSRGYAVVRDDEGAILSHKKNVEIAKTVTIEVQDGIVTLPQK
jgi:exodeoxyribonuclease VII large subunit